MIEQRDCHECGEEFDSPECCINTAPRCVECGFSLWCDCATISCRHHKGTCSLFTTEE